MQGSNISALRTIRILRTLRTVNNLPKMKNLVTSLFNAIPFLFHVFGVFLFLLLVFGIVSTSIYAGKFRQNCTDVWGEVNGALCYFPDDCTGEISEECRGGSCSSNLYCTAAGENPNLGVTSFDNLFSSILTMFMIITMEGWSAVMYRGREGIQGMTVFNDLFFIIIVIIGSFFLVNLVAAVLFVEFHKTMSSQNNTKTIQIGKADQKEKKESSGSYWERIRA